MQNVGAHLMHLMNCLTHHFNSSHLSTLKVQPDPSNFPSSSSSSVVVLAALVCVTGGPHQRYEAKTSTPTMGSSPSQAQKEQRRKTLLIDRELLQAHLSQQKIIKMLLLGTAECGKSTILKQIRILHNDGYAEVDKVKMKPAVYENTVNAMATLLRVMHKMDIPFENPNLEPAACIVTEEAKSNAELEQLSSELASAIKCLWADKNVRGKAFANGGEFQLFENSAHFLDSVDRTSQADYVPTEQDILLLRIRTTGIVEVKFKIKEMDFSVFDVGGQRSERKKWIHCFEGVNSIIYLCAICEFDQVLSEDVKMNRMTESLRLFESICNSMWFVKTAMILFLNKKDLFAEKIKHKSIRKCFKSYTGPNTYHDQIQYIEHRFDRMRADPNKPIYTHHTCATDTNQVEMILDSVFEHIIRSFLQGKGLC